MHILVELLLNSNWKLNEIDFAYFSGVSPAHVRRMREAFLECPGASPAYSSGSFPACFVRNKYFACLAAKFQWGKHGSGNGWLNENFG